MKNKTTKQKRKPREWMAWAHINIARDIVISTPGISRKAFVAHLVKITPVRPLRVFRIKIAEVLRCR